MFLIQGRATGLSLSGWVTVGLIGVVTTKGEKNVTRGHFFFSLGRRYSRGQRNRTFRKVLQEKKRTLWLDIQTGQDRTRQDSDTFRILDQELAYSIPNATRIRHAYFDTLTHTQPTRTSGKMKKNRREQEQVNGQTHREKDVSTHGLLSFDALFLLPFLSFPRFLPFSVNRHY